jgi:hypothetical protein
MGAVETLYKISETMVAARTPSQWTKKFGSR